MEPSNSRIVYKMSKLKDFGILEKKYLTDDERRDLRKRKKDAGLYVSKFNSNLLNDEISNSKNLETDSKILENPKLEIKSETRKLNTIQEAPQVQDETQNATLPDTPESTELTILEPLNGTGFKRGSIEVQTGFKQGSQLGSEQGSQLGSIEVQTGFKQGSKKFKQGSQQGSKTPSQQGSNRVQSVFKINGLEKQILFFLYLDCLRNSSLVTLPYKRGQITQLLECKLESYRTSIRRLKLKGLIAKEGMSGRYGGTTFELTKEVFNEIKLNETWFKQGSQQGSQQGSYITTDIYLRFKNNIIIPDNLKTKISIKQLYDYHKDSDFWSTEALNESLYHFSYDLWNNNIELKQGNPFLMLFGLLAQEKAYVSKNYYKTEQQQQRKDQQEQLKNNETEQLILDQNIDLEFEQYLKNNAESFEKEVSQLRSSGTIKNEELLKKVVTETLKKRYKDSLRNQG